MLSDLAHQVRCIENPYILYTGSVDWIAMRNKIGEAEWRRYAALSREYRALLKAAAVTPKAG